MIDLAVRREMIHQECGTQENLASRSRKCYGPGFAKTPMGPSTIFLAGSDI